jgi:xanthine dehydrogenase accessory factor
MDGWAVMTEAAELARRGEPFALATVVWRQGPSSSQQGSRAIITAGGELRGWIGGACAEPVVIREAQRVISSGATKLLLLGSPDQFGGAVPDGMTVVPISCQSEGALEVYIEPVIPVPHLVIIGHSPMARTLAGLSQGLGWRTDLIDGPDFTSADADEHSMVVVASQGHNDEGLVERAVAARPAYLGLVGSHKRGAAVLGYLADRGVPKEQLDRVKVPAGLDLGKTTHPEIAVAILAELVQLRAAGKLGAAGNLKATRSGAGSAAAARREPALPATDPVCGMTVTAGPDGMPLEHDGATYYFCGGGCRQAFERDPAAYTRKLLTTRARPHADQE